MSSECILIISPHPDDLEIGMGGTVAKMIANGTQVVSLVVTDGGGSTSTLGLSRDELAVLRKSEVTEAASILDVSELILLGLSGASSDNLITFRVELARVLDRLKPAEIYIPHPEIDKHPTHGAVSKAVLEKLGEMSQAGAELPATIWCYEVWTPFPNYDRIEDISPYIELKTAAVNAHKSQLEYKNYTEGILGLNRYRAVFDERHGVTEELYAEVFVEIKI
jgi:N-acetylglucosamine malate deacetylase 1